MKNVADTPADTPRYRLVIRLTGAAIAAFLFAYLLLLAIIGAHAHQLLGQPLPQKADAALILGNRVYLHGAPNPCLTGRVDKGLALARQGLVASLAMSGGRDYEDSRIEATFMADYAKEQGYTGTILLEPRSNSTRENLEFSAPLLKATGIHRVIIVSEPYHLWRIEQLVEAGHLGQDFSVSYAAAPSQCWVQWGMLFKGALREPLAIMDNYAKGYFRKSKLVAVKR